MARWDIDIAGVKRVTTKVTGIGEQYDGEVRTCLAALEAATGAGARVAGRPTGPGPTRPWR